MQNTYRLKMAGVSFIVLLLLQACSMIDNTYTGGKVLRENLNCSFENACACFSSCRKKETDSPNKIEIVGHIAGSFRHYPMDVRGFDSTGYVRGHDWSPFCHAQAYDLSDLMKKTFSSDIIDSIEIDVQSPPDDHHLCKGGDACLYILHNSQNWETQVPTGHGAIPYLERNTLSRVLQEFVDRGYSKTRRLHLEVKSKRGCQAEGWGADCEKLGVKVGKQIVRLFKDGNVAKGRDGANWLSVISFSATALTAVRETLASDHMQDDVDYGLIAGVRPSFLQHKWIGAQAKGSVPLFDDKREQFMVKTAWLDRVWFSLSGVPKFNEDFRRIADQRSNIKNCATEKKTNCAPLQYTVSAVGTPLQDLALKVNDLDTKGEIPFAAMTIEVDDEKNCYRRN